MVACSDDVETPPGVGAAGNAAAGKAGGGAAGKPAGGAAGSAGAAAGKGGSSGAAAGKGGSSGSAAGKGGSSGSAAGTAGSSGSTAGTAGSSGSGGGASGIGGTTAGSAGAKAGGSAGTSAGSAGTTTGGSAGAAGAPVGGTGGSAGAAGGSGTAGAGGSAGTGGGGGGAGGAPPQVCAAVGATITLLPGDASQAGPTSGTKNTNSELCTGKDTVENLIRLDASQDGSLELNIVPASDSALVSLYARDGACDGPPLICTVARSLTLEMVKGTPVFLYVEQVNPGAYTVNTKLTVKNTGGADACAAAQAAITIKADVAVTGIPGDTASGSANVTPPATCTTEPTGKEVVFTLIPEVSGTLFVAALPQAASSFNAVVSVVADCKQPSVALACSNSTGGGANEEVSLEVVGGTTYYVIVDSVGGDGKFQLSPELVKAP